MLQEYVRPDYAYDFKVYAEGRGNSGLTARITTNKFGQGYISIEHQEIPINLAGKGKSKATKKAIRIVQWWINQRASLSANEAFHKYVPYQKRASQRARKKLRRKSL